jgi:threonine dehydrogenase-like Zn-dependent dehydrogenase
MEVDRLTVGAQAEYPSVHMKALTIVPGKANSAALRDVPMPAEDDGDILVRALDLGICGTDFELVSAEYGWAPPGSDYLILGHESLGRVQEAPENSGVAKDDLVVGIVRRPDPVPCTGCASGEWDMCRNERYTERGIKERNGFGSEYWRIEPAFALRLKPTMRDIGVLLEPASILAKAWDHITRIGERATWRPKTVLITGAGPIGLLGALMGAQRGLEVHVLDRVKDGPKPKLVHDLNGRYYTGAVRDIGFRPDVIIECTGVASVISDCLSQLGNDGILCFAGVSSRNQQVSIDLGTINRTMVLENKVVFGSVNANRRHWEMAYESLVKADRNWLKGMISRREPLSNWQKALERHPNDIKVVIEFASN